MFCRIQRSFGVLLPQISAKNPRKSILTRNYVISTWKNPHKPFFSFPRDYSYLCAPMYKFATYKDQYKANLRLALPVPAGCTAVGIRAHDFTPCAADAPNAIPVKAVSTSENPFDWNLIFTAPDGTTRLWWKVSKTNLTAASPEAPAFLGTAPQNIMPLG